MTDERLCKCGHYQHLGRCAISECPCGAGGAAPSTDAGEARKGHECDAWCVFQSWVSEIRGGASNTDDLGLRSAFDAIAAEAREPLEERIRELEAARDRVRDALPEMLEMAGGGEFLTGLWAQRLLDSHNRTKDAEAEVERLREALRDALDTLLDYVPKRAKPYRNGWVDGWWALATPPSSTEGTE